MGGELTIDGIAASELVKEFDTPQYVFSEDTFRARARGYRQAFEDAFRPAWRAGECLLRGKIIPVHVRGAVGV